MNEISWQDPIRKKMAQQKRGGQESRGGASPDSFASQYLQRSRASRTQASPARDNGLPFAARYLGASAGPGSGYHRGQHPEPAGREPRQGGGFHQNPPQQSPWFPGAPSGPHPWPDHGQPGSHQQTAPQQGGHPPGYQQQAWPNQSPSAGGPPPPQMPEGQGQKIRWNYLDLRNKKQTGDLYKTILHYNKKKGFKSFCITSSRTGEGVSTIMANLLAYMTNQAAGKKILAVDTNFQAPTLHQVLGLPPHAYGMVDVLKGGMNIAEIVSPVTANTYALGAGNVSRNGVYNIEPDDFSRFLTKGREMFDFILVDCPPVLSSPDALSVAPSVDVAFLALQSVKVQRQVAQKAISLLQNNETELGGVILNRVQQVIPGWVYKLL